MVLLFASSVVGSLSAAQILISPPGGKFAEAQRVVLSWDDPEVFRSLRYTLDGSEPNETSPTVLTPVAIDIATTATLKVRALGGSESATASFIIGSEVLEFTPNAGTYVEGTAIALTAPYASEAIIYYTLDGSTPSISSPVYSSPIALQTGIQVKAIVWQENKGAGVAQSATYSVTTTPVNFSPQSGDVLRGSTVTLASSVGAAIFYVINPTPLQLLNISALPWVTYVEPLQIDQDAVIYAKSEKSGQIAAVNHAAFSVARLPRPDFSPDRGPISEGTPITITSSFAGAVIRYTLDGSEPSDSSPEYSVPVVVQVNGRLKARAFYPQYTASYTRYVYYRSAEMQVIPPPSDDLPRLKFTKVSESDRAVWITHANDGTGRLFIVQLNGTVGVLGQATPFLSLPYDPYGGAIPGSSFPAEILSVAFPPDYDNKAYFYCSYRFNGLVRVSKFFTLANPNVADAQSEVVVGNYSVSGPSGQLIFGPDGTLYLNQTGSVASHMPASFFQDSDVLSSKLIRILTESGGEEEVEATSGRWPFRDYLNNASIQTVGALLYRGPGRRMQGRYFCGDRSSSIFSIEDSSGEVVGKLLSRPIFSYAWLFEQPSIDYPFDVVAMGEGEDGRLYVSNYGTTIYLQTGPGNTSEPHIVGGGIYRVDDDETVFSLSPRLMPDGHLDLAWLAASGFQYQIQTSEDLMGWQNYLTPFIGDGEIVKINDETSALSGKKFYRIITSPVAEP